jgi:hypothetical protein
VNDLEERERPFVVIERVGGWVVDQHVCPSCPW